MRKWIILLSVGTMLTLIACGTGGKDGKLTIAVIPKGTTHVYWQSVYAGAIKASNDFDVRIIWIGPEKEDNRQQQISLVDNQVMSQVDGMVLAPLDAVALRRPVASAVRQNIPVVIIDSNLEDGESLYTSFVATDNRAGGRLAGRNMGRILGGGGRVVMLRYSEGSASTDNREEGFLEAIRAFPGIRVVSDEQYGGVTQASAQQASENLLLRFKDAAGKLTIDGIFTPNASSTYGMHQALKRQRLTGQVTFIGFDADDPLVEGLRRDEIQGLVVQNPFKMGYQGVETVVKHLKGETVPKRIDTGVNFITRADLDRPEILELIKPDMEKWLSRR